MPVFWIGTRRYRTKTEAGDAVRAVLHGRPIGTELVGEEFDLIRDLLDMHHEAQDKIGVGVAAIRIAPPLKGPYRGFEVVRTDGTTIDFSYQTCLRKPSLRSQVHNVLRDEIEDKTTAYFDARYAEGTFTSDESGVPLQRRRHCGKPLPRPLVRPDRRRVRQRRRRMAGHHDEPLD
ncbi:DCL family protein [Yinghuangia aomiensis]